jgi:hypothetical protein
MGDILLGVNGNGVMETKLCSSSLFLPVCEMCKIGDNLLLAIMSLLLCKQA